MKLLDRHILRELLGPFLFGVAAFTSLMFAGRELFQITELIAEYNAPLLLAVKLMLLQIPAIVVLTLPMSMLLSALLGFGRLSGDSETVALFAGGISIYRIVVPVVLMAIVVTGFSFVLSEIIAPKTTTQHERIFRELKNEPLTSAKPFFFKDVKDGVTRSTIYVGGGYDANKRVMRNVVMNQYVNGEPSVYIYAKEATSKGGTEWSFRDGKCLYVGRESTKNGQTMTMSFKDPMTVKIEKAPTQIALYERKSEELSFSELRGYIQTLEAEGEDVDEYRVKLYQKISLPLASLVFALIGAPLGLRPLRSSSAMGLGLSIVIIFAYWILMHYMTILGEGGAISPAAASFIPTLAGAGAGIALITRAAK